MFSRLRLFDGFVLSLYLKLALVGAARAELLFFERGLLGGCLLEYFVGLVENIDGLFVTRDEGDVGFRRVFRHESGGFGD